MLLRNVLVFLLPIFVCCDEQWNFFRNDYTYNKDTNYWFKINSVPVNWHEARRKCEFEGAALASPLNSKIFSKLQSTLEENEIKAAYVGLHSTFSDGDWQSINGVPLQDMNLNKNIKFSQYTGHKCAVIESKKIINVNCTTKYPYICYKDATDVPCFTECGTTDEEYVLDSKTGSCYKFHREGSTWSRGFEVCRAEGGHLAIIDNATEARVITELFANNPNTTIQSSFKDVANIGVRDWEQNGDWYTVHGEAFNKKGYSMWNDGEPNNAGHNEYCGAIIRNGRLNDVPCSYKLAFICEKEPKSLAVSNTPTLDVQMPSKAVY